LCQFVAKQFTLGKHERLKSRTLIEQLFSQGKSFNSFPFRVFYLLQKVPATSKPVTARLQFGAGASTKNFKKAVDRNRIKRWTREAYRLQKIILEEPLHTNKKTLSVFFIYTLKELLDYKTIFDKTSVILSKLVKMIDEIDSSDT
jgi:ribonuclease P protein component